MAEPIYRVVDNGLGELIAVGANGFISHSTDNGATWVGRNSGTTEHLYGAAYGTVLGTTGWIVVGANGTVLKSNNGATWFTLGSFTAVDLYDVAFGGIFIAVGVGGLMATTQTFGTVWEFTESGTLNDLHSIEIDDGSYIIVGANDTVITGTIYSLEFNIEVIENVITTEALTETRSANETLSEALEANDSMGGRTAGQKVQFTTTGTVEAGDTYRITLDGVNYDLLTTTEVSQSEIVDGLVALIEPTTKFTAYNDGGVLVVTSNNPPTPFTYTSSVIDAGTIDAAIAELKLLESIVQQTSVTLSGTQIGDDYTITLTSPDGGAEVFNYVAVAADDTATATSLAALINASPNYEASATGGVITIVAVFPDAPFVYEDTVVGTGTAEFASVVENLVDGLQFYEYITEEIYSNEFYVEPNGVYSQTVTEVADSLSSAPSTGSFQHVLTETADVTDLPPVYEWSNGIGGTILMPALDVSGDILVANLFGGTIKLPIPKAYGDYATSLGGTLVLPLIDVTGSTNAEVEISGTVKLPFLDIIGQLVLTQGDDEYVVWVINTKNKTHSTYTNFKANSLVSFNGEDLIANDTGIYALSGEDDDGVAIESAIRWVPTDYGTGTLKRLDSAYINIRHATDGKLVTVADENEQREYDCILEGHQTGMHKKRVLCVRGLAGEHWEIGFENRDGKFTLKDIEVTPVASKRRIK